MVRGSHAHAIVVVAASVFGAAAAQADVIAYDNQSNIPALQDFGHNLGLDFNVNHAITISALGAFDNGNVTNLLGADGSSGVTVAIFTTSGHQVGSSVQFLPSNAGTQINGDAFLAANITLASGSYSVVAFNDDNYNTSGATNVTDTLNNLGGALSFVGTARDDGGTALDFPVATDTGPTNRYDAGTFEFQVPEPASLALVSAGVLGIWIGRRRRAC